MDYKIFFHERNNTLRYPATALFQCFINAHTKTHFFQCIVTEEEECDATIFNNSKQRKQIAYIDANHIDATCDEQYIDNATDFISNRINKKERIAIQQFFYNHLMDVLYITHCIAHGV